MRRQSKITQIRDAFSITCFAVMFMRIPDSIRLMLPIITLLSMVAVGYQFGLTVITLIADRSQGGLVQVSQ